MARAAAAQATGEGVLGRDPEDFARLFVRHRWAFAQHARRFLNDQRDVDEVLQESFLKLFLVLPQLDNELQAIAYCRRTITNLCIDRYRATQRRPHLVELQAGSLHLPQTDAIDPLIQAEDALAVRQALDLLSPLHRAALIKREVHEQPLPQIAEDLGIPVEQVKHLLHRARASLRRLLVGTEVEPGSDLELNLALAIALEQSGPVPDKVEQPAERRTTAGQRPVEPLRPEPSRNRSEKRLADKDDQRPAPSS